ncbi:MAG TPA: SRPBCC family protein [Actinomycetota bacterium]|nr:SRPBCC family protein [Actinomycetota bacterium]
MAEKVKDSIDIEASAEEIFEVATDFSAYPDWNANIKQVEIKETDDDGRATQVWYEVDAKIKVLRYTLEYDYSDAPEGFSWTLVEGDVKTLEGSYAFDEFEDVTDVTYELKIDPGFKVPGMLRRQAEKMIVRTALEDLKKRVEAG